MTYLIDGFNLLYKFPDLESLMYEGRLNEARRGLLEKLKEYIKITGARIRIVFDGKKDKLLSIKSEKIGTVDVYYSHEYSADFLIKEFIKKELNPRMITVVTSDRDILFYINRFRAKSKKSEDFAKQMKETVEKWIEEQTPEKDENPELTSEELEYWEKLFKQKI